MCLFPYMENGMIKFKRRQEEQPHEKTWFWFNAHAVTGQNK